MEIIPKSAEKYISLTVHLEKLIKLRFIDSFHFMNSSLDTLVKNLKNDDFRFICKADNELKIKQIFPYEYIDSIERLNELVLPSKECFFSKLKNEGITDEEYKYALMIFDKYKCKSLKDYHDLYLKIDV